MKASRCLFLTYLINNPKNSVGVSALNITRNFYLFTRKKYLDKRLTNVDFCIFIAAWIYFFYWHFCYLGSIDNLESLRIGTAATPTIASSSRSLPFFADKRYSFPDAITTACIDLREHLVPSSVPGIILVHAGRRGNQQENRRRLLSRFLARSGPPDATITTITTRLFLNVVVITRIVLRLYYHGFMFFS